MRSKIETRRANGYEEEGREEEGNEEEGNHSAKESAAAATTHRDDEHRSSRVTDCEGAGRVVSMPLSEYLDRFYSDSATASDKIRTAAFAGIALVWVFRMDSATTPKLPVELIPPALCFAAAIAADVLQYLSGTVVWGLFHRFHEKRLEGRGVELDHSPWLTVPAWTFFVMKALATALGYVWLFAHLAKAWSAP